MLSAVAAAVRPQGVSSHGVLVLAGVQYIGKTSWFKNLAPRELGVLKEGVLLDPKDKDSVYQSVTNWIVELGEVDATFKKADIAQLKAFITKDSDELRLPYQREPSQYARRTVFLASVNEDQFLQDPTGNRRFWTIACEAINSDHGLDMQQVWAEILELYNQGESWMLNSDELAILNTSNEDHESINPVEEKIIEMFDFSVNFHDQFFYPGGSFMTCTQIYQVLNPHGLPTLKDLRQVGAAVRKITGKNITKLNRNTRGFYMPPKVLDNEYSQAMRSLS